VFADDIIAVEGVERGLGSSDGYYFEIQGEFEVCKEVMMEWGGGGGEEDGWVSIFKVLG
jgi:hypothetical protein